MKSKRISGILARCYNHVRATENVTKERMKIFGATFHTFNRSLENLDPERFHFLHLNSIRSFASVNLNSKIHKIPK